jgi:hypothetical protein
VRFMRNDTKLIFRVIGLFLWTVFSPGPMSAATVGPAPIPPSFGLVLDGEQGFSGHRRNGIVPHLSNLKLGPILYVSSFQIEAYMALRGDGDIARVGTGLSLSRFLLEPQKRGGGFRWVLEGGLYSGKQVLGQTGFVLDLDKLLRAGFSVGIGNRPNDHLFFMTTLGMDVVAIGKLFKKRERPY